MIYVCGLDLGQVNDRTALVGIQARGTVRQVDDECWNDEVNMMVPRTRFIEMMPLAQCDVTWIEPFDLNLKYQDVAGRVRYRIERMPAPKYLAIDKTGVGRSAIENYENMSPIGVTITSGDTIRCVGPQDYNVPKRDLIAVPQVLLQNRVLKISSKLPNAELLMRELNKFRVKISTRGHDTYEAWREGDHDDMVLALAIACFTAEMVISAFAAEQLQSSHAHPAWTISPV